MTREKLERILKVLSREYSKWNAPVKELKRKTSEPFRVLIGAVLSTRTKDEVTSQAVERLFSMVKSPEDLTKIPVEEIEEAIYPCGFYKTKARKLKELATILVEKYNSKVPNNMDDLLALPGVGRKVANIVLSRGFGKKAIAVDTHVHRISNRLGLVKTKNPDETERELERLIPEEWKRDFNELIVAFGQVICKPIGPKCGECPIREMCPKIGVKLGRKN